MNKFTIQKIIPTYINVEYEEDGTPYIYYEGKAFCTGGREFFVTIPHVNMEICGIDVIEEQLNYTYGVMNNTTVECKLSNLKGEKIYFQLVSLDKDKIDEDFFKWDGEN